MVGTPDEGRDVYGVRFICDDTVRLEVPNFIGFLRFCGVAIQLELTVFVEDVYEFLADFYIVIICMNC